MPHIQRRKGVNGVTYRVRYVDPDGSERSRSLKRKAAAEDFATSVRHEIRSGTYVDPSAGRQTVRASTVRQWQADLLATGDYAPSTVRGVRGQVAGAFEDAIRDRLLMSSPFDGVKAPEVVRTEVVPLTVAQVRAGERATPDRYRALITLIAGTGLRASEAWGLTRDRLDLAAATVRANRQLVGRLGPEPLFGPPKTRTSVRTVPLPRGVVDALEKHLANYPAEPHELVFRTARGTPLTRTVWGKAWRPKVGGGPAEAMSLPPGDGLHQLRHFYASLLTAGGRSPARSRSGSGTRRWTRR